MLFNKKGKGMSVSLGLYGLPANSYLDMYDICAYSVATKT